MSDVQQNNFKILVLGLNPAGFTYCFGDEFGRRIKELFD
jgi:hypothetical protein